MPGEPDRAAAPALVLDGLRKHFGANAAIDGVSLAVPRGRTLVLLGPSGCGKTTILRSIAGFVELDAGRVRIAGRDVTALAPESRGTGMVFQNYALFPHLTVAENVAFGLRMHRVRKAERAERVAAALDLVQLRGFEMRYPAQLSGGQQQRTALARAVAIRPELLLLDEPFGALDENLRQAMQIGLRKIQRKLHVTTVIVTHDQEEAMIVGDLVAVIRAGRVEQIGAPDDIYDRPASRFVADFMGVDNILDAEAGTEGVRIGPYRVPKPAPDAGAAAKVSAVALRAEALTLVADRAAGDWPGEVALAINLGNRMLYEIEVPGIGRLKATEPRNAGRLVLDPGSRVGLRVAPDALTVLAG